MIALLWNVRGLGNPGTKGTLQSHSRKLKPDLIFLSETKLKSSSAERVRIMLGFENCFAVDRVGRSGGLMLLWKDTIQFTLGSYSRFHIEGWVCDEDNKSWRFLGLYGDPVAANR